MKYELLEAQVCFDIDSIHSQFWNDEGTKPHLEEYQGRGLLKDKAALITGGDSGIGRAVAILFAREGADVSFVYLPEEREDAQATKAEIEKAGRKAHLMEYDLLVTENCKKAVEEHVKTFGKMSILVNNSTSESIDVLSSRQTQYRLFLLLTTTSLTSGAMQEISENLADIDLSVVEKTFRLNNLGMLIAPLPSTFTYRASTLTVETHVCSTNSNVRPHEVCSPPHDPRQQYHQYRIGRRLHGQPQARRLFKYQRCNLHFHAIAVAAIGTERYPRQ